MTLSLATMKVTDSSLGPRRKCRNNSHQISTKALIPKKKKKKFPLKQIKELIKKAK